MDAAPTLRNGEPIALPPGVLFRPIVKPAQTADYLTVVTSSGKPCGKLIDCVDGQWKKSTGVAQSTYSARTVPVPDAASMAAALGALKPSEFILPSWAPGTEDGSPFGVCAAGWLSKRIGTPDGESPLGFFRLDGKWWTCRFKDNFQASTWAPFDADASKDMPAALRWESFEEWLAKMQGARLLPSSLSAVLLHSSSARVTFDGAPVFVNSGSNFRFYVQTAPSSYLPSEWVRSLLVLASNAGLGWMKASHSSTDGATMGTQPWSTFDPSVLRHPAQPEFDGAPFLKPSAVMAGAVVGPASPRVFSGARWDTSTIRVDDAALSAFYKRSGIKAERTSTGAVAGLSWILEDLRPTTTVETQAGSISIADFARSGDTHVRCQVPSDYRDSSSWNAYLGRHKDGTPFLFDNGAGIRHVYARPEAPPEYDDADMPPDAERVRIPGEDDGEEFVSPNTSSDQRRASENKSAPDAFDRMAPHISKSVRHALDLFGRRFRGEEKALPLPWPEMSKVLEGGLWPGAHILTGATGTGKTAFAMQVVINALLDQHPTLYVGLELDTDQIIARLASLIFVEDAKDGRPSFQWSHLYLGKTDPKVVEAQLLDFAQNVPLHTEEARPGGWSSSEITKLAEGLKAKYPEAAAAHKSPLIVIDFLQLVGPTDPKAHHREELRERIGAAAYAGREVARKTGAVVFMLSSISRAGARELKDLSNECELGTSDPSELVGLGKESGDIEFSADTVFTLACEPRQPSDEYTNVWVAIAKQRAGRPDWALLRFNGSWLYETPSDAREQHVSERKKPRDAGRERAEEKAFTDTIAEVLEVLQTGPKSGRELRDALKGRGVRVDRAVRDLLTSGHIREAAKRRGGYPLWELNVAGAPTSSGFVPSSSGTHSTDAPLGASSPLRSKRDAPTAVNSGPKQSRAKNGTNSAPEPTSAELDDYYRAMAKLALDQDKALDVAESQISESAAKARIEGDAIRSSVMAASGQSDSAPPDTEEDGR